MTNKIRFGKIFLTIFNTIYGVSKYWLIFNQNVAVVVLAFSDFNASHGNLFGEKALRADLSIKILREEYRQAYNKSRLFDKRWRFTLYSRPGRRLGRRFADNLQSVQHIYQ